MYTMLRLKLLKIKQPTLLNELLILHFNSKINEIRSRVPSIINLAATATLHVKIKG